MNTKLKKVARKAWANPAIRKLIVAATVGVVGFTGLEISGTTVEAIGAAVMLLVSM